VRFVGVRPGTSRRDDAWLRCPAVCWIGRIDCQCCRPQSLLALEIRCPIVLFETRKAPSNYAVTSLAKQDGLTEAELTEMMTHLAF
jgi:hypothetical protein